MFKRCLTVFLVAIMTISLVACGESSSKPVEASIDEQSLTVWCWDPSFNIYAMLEAERIYQKDHPNFKLNIVQMPWADVQTQLITAGTSGDFSELPDIFLCENKAFHKNRTNFPELFTDLTDVGIPYNEFAASAVANSTVDGKNFGVPFDNGAAVMALRTDILEQAGYTIADFTDITWTQFIDQGKVVLEKTGVPLLSFDAGGGNMILMMLRSCGQNLFDDAGQPIIANNPIVKQAVGTYIELINSGVLVETQTWDEYVATFTKGTAAAAFNGCWILGSVQVAEDQSGKWGVTNVPSMDGVDGATNYSTNGGSSWAVSGNCQNKDLAIDFLKNTYAGSVEFYENILEEAGALAYWMPAGESPIYAKEQEFFGDQAIYADIVDFASKVPESINGVHCYEAVDAIAVAVTKAKNGADIDEELQAAQYTVEFQMSE